MYSVVTAEIAEVEMSVFVNVNVYVAVVLMTFAADEVIAPF